VNTCRKRKMQKKKNLAIKIYYRQTTSLH